MNLALVTAYDATLVPAAPIPGRVTLGWPDSPPEGLTHQDLTRIGEAIAAGRAASTRRTYAWQWGRFERWCAGRGIAALPATPATVCAYLTDFAAQGVAAGTIECACAAIAAEHETDGHPNPIADQSVKAVRRGLRRTLGTAPRRQSRPCHLTREPGAPPGAWATATNDSAHRVAGIPSERVSGHSLRAGHATTAALAGARWGPA